MSQSKDIYLIKRRYGVQATFQSFLSQTVDLETGETITIYNPYHIKRVLVYSGNQIRNYIDLSRFMHLGDMFDTTMLFVLIDYAELPDNFIIKKEDHLDYKTKSYQIRNVESDDQAKVYKILLTALDSR